MSAAAPAELATDLRGALHAAATNSAYAASRSLSKWLRRGVRLHTDGFERIPITQAAQYVGEPDAPVAAVQMTLEGDIQGDVLLILPDAVGRRLVELLMGGAPSESEYFDEMAQSALQETGNIVGTSFANALAQWLNLRIVPASPAFAYDLSCAVIEPVLLADAAVGDHAWMTKTTFELDEERLDWCMLLLLTGESLERIRRGPPDDNTQENALHSVAVNAAFNASRSMSKWLRKGVRISTAGMRSVPLTSAHELLPDDESAVMLHMELEGQVCGGLLLVLSSSSARALVSRLMPDMPASERLDELAQSCLQETANIVSTAFANSVTKWLDLQTRPSPPVFREDMPRATFASMLACQAEASDRVLVSKSAFNVEGCAIECDLFVLPTPESFRLIATCCAGRGPT